MDMNMRSEDLEGDNCRQFQALWPLGRGRATQTGLQLRLSCAGSSLGETSSRYGFGCSWASLTRNWHSVGRR